MDVEIRLLSKLILLVFTDSKNSIEKFIKIIKSVVGFKIFFYKMNNDIDNKL